MKPYEQCEEAVSFPPGPWSEEPSLVEWQDIETGYECCIMRHSYFGHLCGYVRVNEDHPLAAKSYDDRARIPKGWMERKASLGGDIGYISALTASIGMDEETARLDLLFFCHGGLTYGPGSGWFGFDCGHCDDISPRYGQERDGTYRTVNYVKSHCTRLARQLWEYQHLAEFKS